MSSVEDRGGLSHLVCREIQAPLVSALIRAYARKMGEEEALAVAREVIREDASRAGAALAAKYGDDSLDTLLSVVNDVWARDGTMDINEVHLSAEELAFDVTRCGYADMYRRLGLQELGCTLSCNRDFPFMDGFNPEIVLERTETIMEGARRCDFRYRRVGSDRSEAVPDSGFPKRPGKPRRHPEKQG